MLTMFDDEDSVFAALRAGARGYLLKDADREELLRAVSAVHRGEAIFSPAIATRVIDFFARPRGQQPPPAFPELTEREREVLEHMAQGQNNAAIARSLFLTERAVEKHINAIFLKLDLGVEVEVHRRVAAVVTFLQHTGHTSA